MRVLFDECVPRSLKRELPKHDVITVPEMGWAGKKNGELLALIGSAAFDAFVTVDKNMEHHQNLQIAGIPLIVLVAHRNTLRALLPLAPGLRSVIERIRPGETIHVSL